MVLLYYLKYLEIFCSLIQTKRFLCNTPHGTQTVWPHSCSSSSFLLPQIFDFFSSFLSFSISFCPNSSFLQNSMKKIQNNSTKSFKNKRIWLEKTTLKNSTSLLLSSFFTLANFPPSFISLQKTLEIVFLSPPSSFYYDTGILVSHIRFLLQSLNGSNSDAIFQRTMSDYLLNLLILYLDVFEFLIVESISL